MEIQIVEKALQDIIDLASQLATKGQSCPESKYITDICNQIKSKAETVQYQVNPSI